MGGAGYDRGHPWDQIPPPMIKFSGPVFKIFPHLCQGGGWALDKHQSQIKWHVGLPQATIAIGTTTSEPSPSLPRKGRNSRWDDN